MTVMTREEEELEKEKDEEAMALGLLVCCLELWGFALVLFAHWIGIF